MMYLSDRLPGSNYNEENKRMLKNKSENKLRLPKLQGASTSGTSGGDQVPSSYIKKSKDKLLNHSPSQPLL